MKFHPATQILAWCLLVAVMQVLKLAALFGVVIPVMLVTLAVSRHKFIQLLRRTRWVMLSLLLVYAFSATGEPLFEVLGAFSPTREGLTDGALQLTRLLAALAALAVLLDRLHRQALIAGLYTLFAPLCWIGLSRDRVAVRLALTLHYAEVAMLRSMSWQDTLRSLTAENRARSTEDRKMELPLYRFGIGDALLLTVASTLLWLALR